MTRYFVKYEGIKLYCDKNIDIFQRVQTKITQFSKMLDLLSYISLTFKLVVVRASVDHNCGFQIEVMFRDNCTRLTLPLN